MTAEELEYLLVREWHDEDMQVYLNGVEAVSRPGFVTEYEYDKVSEAAKKALKPNADNVLAVHCHQTTGGQFIDVGLTVKDVPKP